MNLPTHTQRHTCTLAGIHIHINTPVKHAHVHKHTQRHLDLATYLKQHANHPTHCKQKTDAHRSAGIAANHSCGRTAPKMRYCSKIFCIILYVCSSPEKRCNTVIITVHCNYTASTVLGLLQYRSKYFGSKTITLILYSLDI